MRICIVGTGYVGLVTGACFAACGHKVICVDADRDKVARLNRGEMPIYEPGLGDIIASARDLSRIAFSVDLAASLRNAQAVFIAVGTPSRPVDGHADLSCLFSVAHDMAPALAQDVVVVVKSTVPVGTCDEVERIIAERRPDLRFHVASNPEFLRAGAAVHDFKRPDRVVIGGDSEACDAVEAVYRPLLAPNIPIVRTVRRSAELIKYAANAFLATKIAYINEMADLCERVGADVQEVAHGMGLDERIGPRFLRAGPGFGGSCFPKDTLALIKMAEDVDTPMRIVESVFTTNERRKRSMARKIAGAVGASLRGKTVALLGLTFKPNTDDMREAPSIALVAGLRDMGATVRAHDPVATGSGHLPSGVSLCASAYEAAQGADALVVVTEWEQFRSLDLPRLRLAMRSPMIVDLRAMYSTEAVVQSGFRYVRIGTGDQNPAVRPVPAAPRRHMNGAGSLANGASRKPGRQRDIEIAAAVRRAPA